MLVPLIPRKEDRRRETVLWSGQVWFLARPEREGRGRGREVGVLMSLAGAGVPQQGPVLVHYCLPPSAHPEERGQGKVQRGRGECEKGKRNRKKYHEGTDV